MVCHQLAKFGGLRYCSSRDKMFLDCHLIKQYHMIKESDDNDKVNHHPVKFGCHRHCSSGDMMVLVCRVIQQDQVTKGSSNFMGRTRLR